MAKEYKCVGCGKPTNLAWGRVVPYCMKCDWEKFLKKAETFLNNLPKEKEEEKQDD